MLCNLKNILSDVLHICLFICMYTRHIWFRSLVFQQVTCSESHWPKLPVAALLGSSLVNTSLSCTCGSVMHLKLSLAFTVHFPQET